MDDEEEVLLALAEVLGPQFLEHIGGPAHALHVIKILEKLCQLDESTIRDKVNFEIIYKLGMWEHQKDFCVPKAQGCGGPGNGDN